MAAGEPAQGGVGSRGSTPEARMELHRELTRRDLMARAGKVGLALAALPLVRELAAAQPAAAQLPLIDGTLQAYFDTIIPGRRTRVTQSGAVVQPLAIAGADPRPGAVEADALIVGRSGVAGFHVLAAPFVADLEARALTHGGPFLSLDYHRRVATCKDGLAFSNPTRPLWELAAFIAFYAFSAAANVPSATAKTSVGYSVMGMPGTAPSGHAGASYGRRLADELAPRSGSLP